VLVPTALGADWGWVADTMLPTRAYENGVFLAYANGSGTQGDMEFLGKSVIAAPNGTELARAGRGSEILYALLDPAMVRKAQLRLPYLLDRTSLDLLL
jgi:predicted amidohydrolase